MDVASILSYRRRAQATHRSIMILSLLYKHVLLRCVCARQRR